MVNHIHQKDHGGWPVFPSVEQKGYDSLPARPALSRMLIIPLLFHLTYQAKCECELA